jgi:selenoprotein W-related protein
VTRPVVKITYCAECGYDGQAVDLSRALLAEFGNGLASLTIIPWADGTFDVSVDTTLVHSMARDGGFPEPATVASAIRARIASAAAERG